MSQRARDRLVRLSLINLLIRLRAETLPHAVAEVMLSELLFQQVFANVPEPTSTKLAKEEVIRRLPLILFVLLALRKLS